MHDVRVSPPVLARHAANRMLTIDSNAVRGAMWPIALGGRNFSGLGPRGARRSDNLLDCRDREV